MDDKKYVFEILTAFAERTVRRLWILIIVLITALFLTNGAWLWYINQYDFESYDVDLQSGDGIATYVGEDGDVRSGIYSGTEEKPD